ncbi:hypothetical protein F4803DRAFT_566207 [Xylaria telfairii]|nr:hypothetical protein F4803DRAFT_566207 [Xylaria telfairii]
MATTEGSATTAIFDITHECLELFDRITTKHDEATLTHSFVPDDVGSSSKAEYNQHSSRDFIGLRNSFLFWIDYTGALSLMDSSLDTRLRGLTDISSMVVEFLDMILRNLQRQPEIPHADVLRWEDASRAIDLALNRLHFLAAAIRKASAKQLEYNVTTFLSEDDIIFHKDAVSLVRWKFPAARKGLCQQLGDSIAVRRRMLLQKHHHAKKLAIRRVPDKRPVPQQKESLEAKLETVTNIISPQKRMVHHLNVPTSGITQASRPDPHAPALRQIHLPKRPALTTLISTISALQEDSFEYPPRPTANPGESRVQCPYCFMPLDSIKLQSRGDDYWRHHVDEDIKPYSCLFPECAEALLFFTRRKEWKSHMELTHSRDWPRKVHTVIWYCDIDHDPPERFEVEREWRNHMKDPASHPKRKLPMPSKAQLDAISPRKKQVALRDRFVCPLCEQVPAKIRPLVEKATGEIPDMQEFLSEHIAGHIKSLSLMSVPCLDIDAALHLENEQSDSMTDSFKRSLNQGSTPKPPSGIGDLAEVSLPSAAWSTTGRRSIAPSTTLDQGATWDMEYSDYKQPDIPPDQLADEKVDDESKRDLPILWGSDFDAKDDSGRTMLSLAAEKGDAIDIDTVDQNGRTPLLWASDCGQQEIVMLLLDSGANIEATDQQYGRTPLSWAAARCHETVVAGLLERGAYVDAADNSSRTPLSWAASRGSETILRLLLNAGAWVDSYDHRHGRSPLLWAATRGHEAAVKLLIERGSDIEAIDKEHGRTPLSWAAENGHGSVVTALLDHGANIEAADKDYGQTPISFAAENGQRVVVDLLVRRGADVHAVDQDGRTAQSWAAEKGHKDIVELLQSC